MGFSRRREERRPSCVRRPLQTIRKLVFNIARRMMRSNEDAEDVVQESFQQAFIHLKRFKGDARFSTWLTRIATNAAR